MQFFLIVIAAISFVISAIAITGMALTEHGIIKFDQVVYSQQSTLYGEYSITSHGEPKSDTYYFCGMPRISARKKRTSYKHNTTTQYGRYDYISFFLQAGTRMSVNVSLKYKENGRIYNIGSENAAFYFLDYDNFLNFRHGRGFASVGGSYTGKNSSFFVTMDVDDYGEYYAVVGAGITGTHFKVNTHRRVNKWLLSEWDIDINRTFLDVSNPKLKYSHEKKCYISTKGCNLTVVVVQVHNESDFHSDDPCSLEQVTSVSGFMKFKTEHRFWIFGVPVVICSMFFVLALTLAYRKVRENSDRQNLHKLPPVMSVCSQFSTQHVGCSIGGCDIGSDDEEYYGPGSFPALDTPEDSIEQPLLLKAKEFGESLDTGEKPISGIGILSRSTSTTSLRGAGGYSVSPRSPRATPKINTSDSSSNSDSASSSSPTVVVKKVPSIRPVGGSVSCSGMSSINTGNPPRSSYQSPYLNASQNNFIVKTDKDRKKTKGKN